MNQEPTIKQSDWNTAGFTNYRFHKIKELCHESRFSDDHNSWIKGLYAYYSELYPQLTTKDAERIKEDLNKARDQVKHRNAHNKEEIHDTLLEVELLLEKYFDKHGNKFSYKEDGSTALGRI